MAGQNILKKLNAARRGVPPNAAGGTFGAPRLGIFANPILAAYSIPGFGEQRAKNQEEVLRTAQGPLNELRYIGNSVARGQMPYSGARMGSIPPTDRRGESYRDAELRLSAAARAAGGPSAGGGIGGGNAASSLASLSSGGGGGFSAGSPAAERAYQQEVSRVAQLTAQDPELQRYEKARKIAAGAGATPEQVQSAEDIGMQIWAKKYGGPGGLASKVKPGQAGYDVIQNTLGAGQMGSPLNLPFDASNPLGGTPAPANVSYAGTTPTPLTGMGALPMNAFGGITSTPFTSFGRGQTLQSAPLGMPSEMPNASYAGATGVTPVGTSITEDAFKGDKAKQLAAMYLNAQMGK